MEIVRSTSLYLCFFVLELSIPEIETCFQRSIRRAVYLCSRTSRKCCSGSLEIDLRMQASPGDKMETFRPSIQEAPLILFLHKQPQLTSSPKRRAATLSTPRQLPKNRSHGFQKTTNPLQPVPRDEPNFPSFHGNLCTQPEIKTQDGHHDMKILFHFGSACTHASS
jgi:hypothetical protein